MRVSATCGENKEQLFSKQLWGDVMQAGNGLLIPVLRSMSALPIIVLQKAQRVGLFTRLTNRIESGQMVSLVGGNRRSKATSSHAGVVPSLRGDTVKLPGSPVKSAVPL